MPDGLLKLSTPAKWTALAARLSEEGKARSGGLATGSSGLYNGNA